MKEMVKTKEFKDFWKFLKNEIESINYYVDYTEQIIYITDEIMEKMLNDWKIQRKQEQKDIKFAYKILSIINNNKKLITFKDLTKNTNSTENEVKKAINFLFEQNLIQTSFEVL